MCSSDLRPQVGERPLQQPNLKGTFADLRPGATVEVKPEGQQRGVASAAAEWIKVQAASP